MAAREPLKTSNDDRCHGTIAVTATARASIQQDAQTSHAGAADAIALGTGEPQGSDPAGKAGILRSRGHRVKTS
jgi:hypothetical protein